MRRDLGENNAVKRPHLDVWNTEYAQDNVYGRSSVKAIQSIIDKIEHKLERCEKFLENNQDNISLSYYTEGYYNGRARALEDVIDTFTDCLNDEKIWLEPYD